MPYIKKKDRDIYINRPPNTAGELNYIFSKICLEYVEIRDGNYQDWNDTIGALECCKQELYRRFIAPYEDKKIKENGDIV